MGFKDLGTSNRCLLAKQGWRLLNNEQSLLHRVLKARYFRNSNFLQAKMGSNPSQTWRGLMAGKSCLLKGVYKAIGNGNSTCIWGEPWVETGHLIRSESRNSSAWGFNRVCDLLSLDGCSWDLEKLQILFPDDVCQSICKVEICQGIGEDRWIWDEDPRGLFTVRSCYNLAMQEKWEEVCIVPDLFFHVEDLFWKRLWKLPLLSRYRVFLWRVCLNILPTVEALERRGIVIDELCPFCNMEREEAFHVLIECSCLQSVWMNGSFDFSGRSFHASILEWLVVEGKNWSEEKWCYLVVALYQIWQARNHKNFCNKAVNFEFLWQRVEHVLDEISITHGLSNLSIQAPLKLSWSRPEYPFLKLNVDSATARSGGGTLSGVIRDNAGVCVRMFVEQVPDINDSLLLEALAIKKGLEVATGAGFESLEVESDAKLVVEMLNSSHQYVSRLGLLCREILNMKPLFQEISFSWIPRICNLVADTLAKFAKAESLSCIWSDCFPLFISDACINDLIN